MTEYVHLESDYERDIGPVVIARKVHEQVMDRNDAKVSADLASVRVDPNQFGGFQFRLHFHQSVVNNTFEFDARTAEREPIGDTTSKATDIRALNDDIGLLAQLIKTAYDTNPWEFAELKSGSIGGTGALTDYEFEYETGSLDGDFHKNAMDVAIDETT